MTRGYEDIEDALRGIGLAISSVNWRSEYSPFRGSTTCYTIEAFDIGIADSNVPAPVDPEVIPIEQQDAALGRLDRMVEELDAIPTL